MIVQVVACEIRENAPGKVQTTDTLLMNGVRRTFHESIFTSRIHHFGQQAVQRHGVGRGVVSLDGPTVDEVAHRRAQAALVSQRAEQIVEHSGNGRFTIGTRHAHQFQFA